MSGTNQVAAKIDIGRGRKRRYGAGKEVKETARLKYDSTQGGSKEL